jgi:hypothetical protein
MERDHSEYLGVDGKIVLKWIFKKLDNGWGVDWIDLAQEMSRWRALVNTIVNMRVPYKAGNFLTS